MTNFKTAVDNLPLAQDIVFAKFQTKRTAPHTITNTENTNGAAIIALTWDAPFADANYSLECTVETIQGTVDGQSGYYVSGFEKTATGMTIGVTCVGQVGDVISVNAVAVHD